MQDAMTIWDSICHSQWFKQTSIVRKPFVFDFLQARSEEGDLLRQILFLNKNDLFEQKIPHSDIKNFFPVLSSFNVQ
jgi:guanine nucleotide-binding protein subunit alpha, other